MGWKDSSPKLPASPGYEEDPRFSTGLDRLFGLGGRLTSFDFTGDLSPLAETISTSPETTKMFFSGLKAELDPIFRDIRQNTINQLAANNQLESSTTANKLGGIESDLQKKYITAGTTFGLADIERALRNRITLFGMGVDITGQATSFAQSAEKMKNVFNLESYENKVAAMLYGDDKGGWGGAVAGGLGGAATGAAIGSLVPGVGTAVGAGVGALAGGLAGYFGSRGTGRQMLSGGNLAMASTYNYVPRSSAGSGRELFNAGGLGLEEKYPYLLGNALG